MADSNRRPEPPPPLEKFLLCPPEAIEAALRKQSPSLNPSRPPPTIGELLLKAGAITEQELADGLRDQRIARLRACPVFATLTRDELAELSKRFREVSVRPGQEFIVQDQHDPTLYVLASGRVEVLRRDESGQETILACLGPGEPIGEMGYFQGGIRTASVRALETTELLRADYSDLTEYFETMPQVAPRFVELVDRRRRDSERRMRQQARAGRQGAARLNHLLPILEPEDTRKLLAGMETLIDRLVRAAAKLTDADRGLLFLVDETTGEIWTRAPERTGSAELRLPRGSGIAGWVIANNELVNVDDAAADERFSPEIDERTGYKSQTLLCVPVAHKGRVIGALEVINKSIGAFDEQDEALLRALAEHIGHASLRLSGLRRFAKNYDTVTCLLDVATLVTESRNRETLFERLCARVAELLDCERCDCFLLDYAKDALWIRRREDSAKIVRLPLVALPAGYTASTGQLINIADVSNDFRFNPQIEKYLGVKVRNLLSAPLLNRKRGIVAVLQAVNKRNGVFDDADEELLRAVTTQVGTSALINA